MASVMPHSIPTHNSFDYTVGNQPFGSRAQEASNQFFGLQNDNHYDQHVRRALHERSVNTQYENLARAGVFNKDYPLEAQRSGQLVLDDDSVQYLRGWNATYEKEFRILWQRCWKNEQFSAYRTVQPKPDRVAKEEDKKWTPLREEMFFRACVRHRPVGREKVKYSSKTPRNRDKQMGRNELVADRVNEWLCLKEQSDEEGAPKIAPEELALGRKQVSSHLQVLKGKFQKVDPWVIEKYLGVSDTKKGDRTRSISSRGHAHMARLRSSQTLRTEGSRNALAAAHARPVQFNGNVPTLPSQSEYHQQNLFEPADFRMYMRTGCEYKGVEGHVCASPDHCKHKTIHMYTKTQEKVRGPDAPLVPGSAVAGAFPDLANGQDCPVLYANASMSLPHRALGKEQRQNLELSIDSTFITEGPIDPDADWYVYTRFFESGQPANWYTFETGEQVEQKFALQSINVDTTGHAGRYRHSVPFGSSYWVNKVSKLNDLQTACERAHSQVTETSGVDDRDVQHQKSERHYRENVKSMLNSTTALQEVFARRRGDQPHRVFMIYWHFKQTSYASEIGTTVFRNLHIVKADPDIGPNDRFNVNSHHEQTHLCPSNMLDPSSDYDIAPQRYNASPLDALASAAFASAPEHDSMYDIDWSAFDHLETAFDSTAHTLTGAEPYSSFVDVPFVSYATLGIDHPLMTNYDLNLGFHQQTQIGPLSTSPSSATSPNGDHSLRSDYLGGDGGESQPSTAASSYATSAQYTPAPFQSPNDFSQHRQAFLAFSFDPHSQAYDTHHHAHVHQHTHVPQQYYSPNFYQVPTLRSSHSYKQQTRDSQVNIGMDMDTQDSEETLHFAANRHYADGVSQQTQDLLSQHCAPDLEQPMQQYSHVQETQEPQAGAGAASVAHMYDANFFANVHAGVAGEGVGADAWDE